MISRCPSCAAEVSEEAPQCPSCYWDFAAFKRIPPKDADGNPVAAKADSPPKPPEPPAQATGSERERLQMYSFAEPEGLTKTSPPSPAKEEEPAPPPAKDEKKVRFIDFAEPEEIAKTRPPINREKKAQTPPVPAPVPRAEIPKTPPPPPAPPPAPAAAPEFGEGLKVDPPFSIPLLPPSRQQAEPAFALGSIPALPPVKKRAEEVPPAALPEFPKPPEEAPASAPPENRPEPKPSPEEKKPEIPRTSMVKKAPAARPAPGEPASSPAPDPAARFKKKDQTAPSRLKPVPESEELPVRWLVGGLSAVALGGGLAIFIMTKPDSTSTRKPNPAITFQKSEPVAPPTPAAIEKQAEPAPPAPPIFQEAPAPVPPAVEPVKPPPAPSLPPPEPKKDAEPAWVFEGRVYGLLDLESVYHAAVIFLDETGKEAARTVTADEGRFSVSVPAPVSGAYQIKVEQPDYLDIYVDEISPPFKSMERSERAALKPGLAKSAQRHQPWRGRTSAPTKRDIIMIPKLAE